ncbi:hypothetical protein [Asticcacaulis sp. AND118]|uniref:hypothetical protein n=1 Tax=Asticcacaulis sp. AND118 TaxID=2840468 RepID=UPI001D000251|nr:hypothetical protein [Asticcacaulis sp. AND118]UDF03892.1 hypothetical protein LH365_02295 [Asticcacaulis sp. AND118]
MKHLGKIAIAAIAASSLLAGSVYAQVDCKKKCNDAYQACQKSGKEETKCLAAWVECKKKCK